MNIEVNDIPVWEVRSGRKNYRIAATRWRVEEGILLMFDKDGQVVMLFNNWDWAREVVSGAVV